MRPRERVKPVLVTKTRSRFSNNSRARRAARWRRRVRDFCFGIIIRLLGNDLNPEAASAVLPGGAERGTVPVWKHLLDVACLLIAAPVVVPLALLIVVLIKLVSRGPVLFRQERVGYRGRRFVCLKFRTMTDGADTAVYHGHLDRLMSSNLPMVKMDAHGDSRLIRGGWLLRAAGLDELPQLINVLRGEMSLIGPRPCVPYEYERYRPDQRERFNTLPGLTGLWQVSGKNNTTFDEMIRLDIHYARSKTLWLELRIILATVPALVIQIQETRMRRRRAQRRPFTNALPTRLPVR